MWHDYGKNEDVKYFNHDDHNKLPHLQEAMHYWVVLTCLFDLVV